jgi:parvulin-like peptidyl-prolyl isomerase
MIPAKKMPVATLILGALLGLTACRQPLGLFETPTPEPSLTPSPTPIPMAVTINGEGITRAEFEAEVARYQQAQTSLGQSVSPEAAAQTVMANLVDSVLLAQGAAQKGFVVDEATLQARLDALAAQVGGAQTLSAWETAHGYSEADFRSALRRQMAAAWMRDQIAASIPLTADQVHVKQILLYNAEEAQKVLAQLQSGVSFEDLAAQYDSQTHGELGWFPRGYLTEPAIEAAVFGLQPGQYSSVVQSQTGFHIFMLVERDPAHPLAPEVLLVLQEHALQDWLDQRRNTSIILLAP